jgi:hypothetical protein
VSFDDPPGGLAEFGPERIRRLESFFQQVVGNPLDAMEGNGGRKRALYGFAMLNSRKCVDTSLWKPVLYRWVSTFMKLSRAAIPGLRLVPKEGRGYRLHQSSWE